MSRIGKKPIAIPKGVEVRASGPRITVKGPKGELSWTHPDGVSVAVEGAEAVVTRKSNAKPARALHGLTRALLQNMVTGVTEGFKREMELSGVGYRAQGQGDKLVLSVGYSQPVEFKLPAGVSAEVDKKQTKITLSGIDKQQLGQTAADIKAVRPPDSYKGKGIRYAGERLKLKAGKAAK
ncbi:MAG: 50S ribosomal protein L6 [Nitrospirota bacterium]|jgi:large subunit ribosomal protein L6